MIHEVSAGAGIVGLWFFWAICYYCVIHVRLPQSMGKQVAMRSTALALPLCSKVSGLGCVLLLCAAIVVVSAPTARAGAPSLAGHVVPTTATSVAVTLGNAKVFSIRLPLGQYSSEERAEACSDKLVRVAEDPFYSEDLLRTEESEKKATIFYRNDAITVVTDKDAALLGASPAEAASTIVGAISDAVARFRQQRLPEVGWRLVTALGGSMFLLALSVLGLHRTHKRLAARVASKRGEGPIPEGVGALIIRAEKAISVELKVLGLLRTMIGVLLFAAALGTVFVLIPLTRNFALGLLEYVLDPLRFLWQGFVTHIEDVVFILVILFLTRYFLKFLYWLLSEVSAGGVSLPGISPEWAMHLYRVLRLVVLAAAVVMIYPYIPGSDTPAFKGISLFAGALFTLGASGTAGSVIAGLVLVFMGAFRAGDRVAIGDVVGDVVECSFLLTRIRTPKNEIVSIPNSTVMSKHLVNYSAMARREGLILHTEVTIGYDAPWRKVHALLIEAALRTADVAREPAPFVLQKALSDFFVAYEINAYTADANRMAYTYGELHQNIQDVFNEAGVEILSPHFRCLRDGNLSTIPEAHRPSDEKPRQFVVHVDGGDSATPNGASSTLQGKTG